MSHRFFGWSSACEHSPPLSSPSFFFFFFLSTFSPRGTDDATQDDVISKKMQLFRWVEPQHFDIVSSPLHGTYFKSAQDGWSFCEFVSGIGVGKIIIFYFILFFSTELLKLNKYKAPRDKIICILNCCKVIFDILFNSSFLFFIIILFYFIF